MQELEKILEEIDREVNNAVLSIKHTTGFKAGQIDMAEIIKNIIRKHMNDGQRKDTFEFDFAGVKSFDCQCGRHYVNTGGDGWIPVDTRLPGKREWRGYDINTNVSYMRRLEIAYMTDTIEYTHGYYDGYKWMDEWQSTIKNVVAWKIHEPYRPERSRE